MTPNLTCPNCSSKAIRSRRAVYEGGTSNYRGRRSTNGMSFGFGKNFRPRLYFGGGRHSGVRQSVIAQKAAPVPMWLGLPVFLIIFFISSSFAISSVIALSWATFAFFINAQFFEKEWICSKCGEMFDPEKIRLLGIVSEVQNLLPHINSGESKQKRKNSAAKVIELLDELESSNLQHTIKDFHNLKEKLSIVLKSTDALDLLDKADKAHFLKNKNQEIKHLLEALYSLRKNQVTVRQFDSLKAKSEITGEIWTINLIKKKILEAGYVPSPK